MLFLEKKTEAGFEYDTEDVFGTLHIDSPMKIEPGTLDDMVVFLLKQSTTAQTIEGTVQLKEGEVAYRFVKATAWSDDDDEPEPCDDTPTSTPEPESASTVTPPSKTSTSSWLRRFVAAFLEAWRSAKE